jgi:antitoxin ParD1/3/4
VPPELKSTPSWGAVEMRSVGRFPASVSPVRFRLVLARLEAGGYADDHPAPPDIEASIRQKIERGRFPDVDEVLREAMRLLDDQERRLDALRAKIQIGLDEADRGEMDEWTPELRERLWREADEMHRRGEQPDPDVCP